MTGPEFKSLVALIWGRHGGQQRAARHFGVSDRTIRRWIDGSRRIPENVAAEMLGLTERIELPAIAPPQAGSDPLEDRDDAAADAIRPAYVAVMLAAERAGWEPAEALTALLSWVTTDMRRMSGDATTKKTLEAAMMMLDE